MLAIIGNFWLHLSLVLSVSISSAVVGEIKMLLQRGVLKNSKGDISTFGIKKARSFPVLTTTKKICFLATRMIYFSHNFPDFSFSIISKAYVCHMHITLLSGYSVQKPETESKFNYLIGT